MFSAPIRKLLACAVILAALPTAAVAVNLQSVTTIYYPGSTFTLVKGVNDYGELVGEYWTPLPNNKHETHAFYYDGSSYHDIDRNPAGGLNEAWGINNAGVIAADGNENGVYTGYYGMEGNFINYTVGAPNALFEANDANIMVGSNNESGTSQPFIYDLAQDIYTDINVPWGNRSATVGINNYNQVVGSFWNSGGTFIPHGYLFDGTGYTQIDFPGSTGTEALGINDVGLVAGYYLDASSERHGFLYDIYSEVFTAIDIPLGGNSGTRVYEISNTGLLVGDYIDAGGVHRGFIASIVPVPPALLLFGSGLAGLFGMTRLRRRPAPDA
jgi:hypothetical protein